MSSFRPFAIGLTIALLLLLAWVCLGARAPRIESQLLADSRAVLTAQGLPEDLVRMDGRDAHLEGRLVGADAGASQAVATAIGDLPGVRRVFNGLEVAAAVESEPAEQPVDDPVPPPPPAVADAAGDVADAQRAFDEMLSTATIEFETGNAVISAGASDLLDRLADVFRQYPQARARVEGHTDDTGGDEANLVLSEARARAVVNALVQRGIDASRLGAVGRGSSRPVADNTTPEGRRRNRRVAFVVLED